VTVEDLYLSSVESTGIRQRNHFELLIIMVSFYLSTWLTITTAFILLFYSTP